MIECMRTDAKKSEPAHWILKRYLFRGKRVDNGEWVEGDLVHSVYKINDVCVGQYGNEIGMHEVDPSTICQCTGYEGIYEKDIFQCEDERYVIEWSDYSLSWEAESIFSSETISLGEFLPKEIDVIGNVFDNPELLE